MKKNKPFKTNSSLSPAVKSGDLSIHIMFFGQISEITGTDHLLVENVDDTDQLLARLNTMFPVLINMKYIMAVDKKMITGNTPLGENCTVALLPPFSGG
jgi:sulfur-carrier protein